MSSIKAREFLPSHMLGLVAIFIALTGTALAGHSSGGDGPSASPSVVTNAKFKKLKKSVAALRDQVATLQGQVTTLQNQPSPVIPTIPTTLPPSGSAGGDLTGNYPNPLIGPNAVGSTDVADGSLTSGDLGPNSVGGSELAFRSVIGDHHKISFGRMVNFGAIAGEACAGMGVAAPGISLDHVAVTPPPGFPATFTLTGVPDPGNNEVDLHACNHFPTGSVDPDGGGGGLYLVLAIE